MDQATQAFLTARKLAIVGVSRDSKKFGSAIYTELKGRGYAVFPVNPSAQDIRGETCYPNLTALQGQIDGAVICVSPQQVEPILREAASLGMKRIWLQQGTETPEALELGKELGLNLVSGKCILMYAEPVRSIHSVHRFFAKLFGQL